MGILRVDKISGLAKPTAVSAAAAFDGTGDSLTIGNHDNFSFLSNALSDWTLECWVYSTKIDRSCVCATTGNSAGNGFRFDIMTQKDGQADRSGVFVMITKGSAGNYKYWGANDCLKINTWHHIALDFRAHNKFLTLYVDGKELDNDEGQVSGSFASNTYSSAQPSFPLTLGEEPQNNGDDLSGYISNFRIVHGRRLYTSDYWEGGGLASFTPPVHALEPIDGTVVLCCNNPDSVSASSNAGIGTAHIITPGGDPGISTTVTPSLTRDFTSGTEFRGVTTFDTQGYFVPPSGTTAQRDASGSRGMIAAQNNSIEYITISSTGNTKDFGDLSYAPNGYAGSCSSSTRGLVAGGYQPDTNHIDYVTIASQGDGKEFGDIAGHATIYGMGGCGSNTRGLLAGGFKSPTSNDGAEPQINYMTFASIGNSQDFGDLVQGVRYCGSCSSPTRGVWAGGRWSGSGDANWNIIQYVTISTLGDAINFGDLNYSTGVYAKFGCSSDTRGVFGGGTTPTYQNEMSYITIASQGNSSDFGDLTQLRAHPASMTNKIRGVWAGGYNPSARNTIDYVTIASTGNAQDFGDCLSSKTAATGFSNSHGGIS